MAKTRKERGHYGFTYRRIRAEIFATSVVCHLCGYAVDKTLPWRHPGAPQLHLRVPITKGGSWRDKNNMVLTHRICNIRQNNKMEGEVAHGLVADVSAHWIVSETP